MIKKKSPLGDAFSLFSPKNTELAQSFFDEDGAIRL